jgi:hypothetical protein
MKNTKLWDFFSGRPAAVRKSRIEISEVASTAMSQSLIDSDCL